MPKSKNPNKRQWQPREQRLVAEYVARFYSGFETRTHIHLGKPPPRLAGKFISDEDSRLIGVFRRWADAVVIMPDRIVLIEGKILPVPGVISQLKLYEELLPKTRELAEFKDLPIEKLLLCALEDRLISDLARREGIRVVIFYPVWIDEYLKILRPFERTPGLSEL